MGWLADRLLALAERKAPNRVTAAKPDGSPAMLRWELIRLNKWFNIYIHKFLASDRDRALHDHPWWGFSLILRGQYVDVSRKGRRLLQAGDWMLRPASRPHRIELVNGEPCWTLFIVGPRVREWGFYCPGGWVGWREFNKTGCPAVMELE